jgi:hypothetical protein
MVDAERDDIGARLRCELYRWAAAGCLTCGELARLLVDVDDDQWRTRCGREIAAGRVVTYGPRRRLCPTTSPTRLRLLHGSASRRPLDLARAAAALVTGRPDPSLVAPLSARRPRERPGPLGPLGGPSTCVGFARRSGWTEDDA